MDLQTRRSELLAQLANPSDDTDVAALIAEADELSTRIAEQSSAAAARARLLAAEPQTAEQRSGGGTTVETRERDVQSPGQAFVESESFRSFRERGATGSAQLMLPNGLRALIDNTGTSAGAFQNPARPTDVPMANADRVPRIADLLDRRNTDSNTVEYVQDTTAAGGGAAAETAEGGLKPESTYTFAVVSEPVRTVAHWVNMTRQSVDDNAMLRGYVEGRLTYGLDYRLDQQVLNGNGTSPNLRGILNVAGIGAYAAPAGEAALISIRRAITTAQTSEYAPDTVVLNPIDWERVELSADADGMFRVSPNVANALAPRIWGLVVVPTMAITGTVGGAAPVGGTFLVGAFRMGATLWERQGTTVLMTDSHASNFTSNILTLLAEMRAALAVWRPKAFVKGTFSTGTA